MSSGGDKYYGDQELVKRINETAYAIKFTNLSDTYKDIEQTRLMEYICKYLKMNLTKTIENVNKARPEQVNIKLDMIFDAFISSMGKYGKLDEETGELIPYIKMFMSHYDNKYGYSKLPDGSYVEKDNEISKAREASAKNILKRYIVSSPERYKGYTIPKRIKNIKVFKIELMKLGLEESDAEDIAESVFSGVLIEELVDYNVPNQISIQQIDVLADVMEKIMIDKAIKDEEKVFAKYLVSQNLYESNINIDFECEGMYDEEFFRALHDDGGVTRPYEILAKMLGLKPDTARKKLSKAKTLIQQFYNR